MTALHAGDGEGVLFANQRIRTPLAVGGEVAVFQVVAGEALVAWGEVVFDDGEGKTGEAVHMHLNRCQPGGGADGIVVSQHLSHGGVDALDDTVAVGVVGARCDFSHAKELVHGKRQLGAEL